MIIEGSAFPLLRGFKPAVSLNDVGGIICTSKQN